MKTKSSRVSGNLESLESRLLFSYAAESIVPHPAKTAPVVSTAPSTKVPRGNGITAEYFSGSDFQNPVAVNNSPEINFKWSYGKPVAALPAGVFGAQFTGEISPAKTDTYTFYTKSDAGTRVIVNGVTVIDNIGSTTASTQSGSIQLTGGTKVSIEVDYLSRAKGLPRVLLAWSSSTFSKRLVPTSVLYRSNVTLPVEPLTGYYFNGKNFGQLAQTQSDTTINYKLAPQVPDARFPQNDPMSVRWIGYFTPPVTGVYTFRTITDDGVRLFVAGDEIINHWSDESSKTHLATMTLNAGTNYALRMDYYNNGVGQGVAKLLWKVPGSKSYSYVPFVSPVTPVVPVPAAPTNVTATAASSSQINLTWTAVAGANQYLIERSTDGGATFTSYSSEPAPTTAFSDTGLTPGTSYSYKIIATNAGGDSESSTAAAATTLPGVPGAPVVTATVSGTSATVNWNAVPSATSYQVQRSVDSTNWTTLATTSATTYTDSPLSTATTYYYRVIADNVTGDSIPSNTASITTIPAAPTNPQLTVLSASQIKLNWNGVAGNGTTIQESADGSTGWTTIGSVPAGTSQYTAGGLAAATTYYFRLIATNSVGNSSPSTVVHGTTSAANPPYASLTTLYGLTGTGKVYSIDTTTGAATQIGTLSFGTNAAARDPLSGNFFYISTGSSSVAISEWNPNDGSNSVVNAAVPIGNPVAQAAFRDDGQFFLTDDLGDVFAINSLTGVDTPRGTIHANGSVLNTGNGDMAFAPDGTLYDETSSELYSITPAALSAGTGSGSIITATDLGPTNTANLQIAFGQNGILYGTAASGQLYTLSTSTGAATAVGTASGFDMGDLASVPLYSDLSITQTASSFVRGTAGSYSITVNNAGPDSTVGPITLVDTLPTGITYASGSGNGWTFSVSGQTVTMTYVPNVLPGASTPAITLNVNVGSGAAGSVSNTLNVSSTDFETNTANNVNTISTAVSG